MDGNASGHEILRREPLRARKVIDAALEEWAESSRIRNQEHQRLASEIDRARETTGNLDAEPRSLTRRLTIHENHNNPTQQGRHLLL